MGGEVLSFWLGASVGSLINAAEWRIFRGLPLTGRSFCDYCGKKIPWRNNLPVLSWLLLKGRSSCCHLPLPCRYPLVELLTGVLFVLIFRLYWPQWLFLSLGWLMAALLVFIAVFDACHQLILDQSILIFFGLAFGWHWLAKSISFLNLQAGLLAAGFLFLLYLLTRGKGMGLGDVKFAFVMGFFLGWPAVIWGVYLAFLTGGFVSAIMVLWKKKGLKDKIAFGPFLVSATFLVWLANRAFL